MTSSTPPAALPSPHPYGGNGAGPDAYVAKAGQPPQELQTAFTRTTGTAPHPAKTLDDVHATAQRIAANVERVLVGEIGRASCRERV